MLKRVAEIAVQIVEGLAGIVGIRVGTEEPHHLTQQLTDRIEIRSYGPRIAAETTVFADDEKARNVGFRRLAGYIFGGNQRRTTIAMTAPVAQQNEKIAMTAPVAQSAGPGGGSVIRFFMPAKWSLATLPKPDDDSVRLVEVPAEMFAVLRFTGDRGPATVRDRTAELLAALSDKRVPVVGEPVAWFYDPPWTVPRLRRNEVAVPIRSESPGETG
jgi:SOUL heme-binding protein